MMLVVRKEGRMKMRIFHVAVLTTLLPLAWPSNAAAGDAKPVVQSVKEIGKGCFPRWSPDGKQIAFTKETRDRKDSIGIGYEIYTKNPDGTKAISLTQGKAALDKTRWRAQASWHPSVKYLVFTAEAKKYKRKGNGTTARPGIGRNHNIWIMTSDGSKFWQITDYPDNWGAIRPFFSRDGKTLCWNEEFSMEKYPQGKKGDRKLPGDPPEPAGHPGSYWGHESKEFRKGEELGAWRIVVADIDFSDDGPKVTNKRKVKIPEGYTLIEASGFAPDGKSIVCSVANLAENSGRGFWGDVYLCNLKGQLTTRLTKSPRVHDENPLPSPDGTSIIWNRSATGGDPGEGEELWIMDADGGSKTQLTNYTKPGSRFYSSTSRQITEADWSPDGTRVVLGRVVQDKRGGPHIPSTLYVLAVGKEK
jgi:Tol biopolymer transport system component